MRYAIYYCPAVGSALAEFGRVWLAQTPHAIDLPGIHSGRMQTLLTAVRRYGWHATIRAPFALAAGVAYADLRDVVVAVAQRFPAVTLPLQLDRLAGFLALRPSGDSAVIDPLAAACLQALEPLRAPLAEEVFCKHADGFDAVELDLLARYGYPYVLDHYRFHMSLSAPATEPEEQILRDELMRHAATWSTARVDALSICREAAPGADFEQIERIPLRAEHGA
jgi:hypothetical protein